MKKLIILHFLIISVLTLYSNNFQKSKGYIINSIDENNTKVIFIGDSVNKDSLYIKFPNNSIYLEFLGEGIFGSINYERILYQKSKFSINGRVGCLPEWIVPVLINGQIQITNKISFEIGIGTRYIYSKKWVMDKPYYTNSLDLIGNTGFRFFLKNKILIKIDYTPQFSSSTYIIGFHGKPVIWFGFSIGYSFGK